MVIRGSLGDGRERAILVDPVANAIITLPNNHSYIHKGQHFKARASSASLTNTGEKLGLVIEVPASNPQTNDNYDELYHMVFRAWSSGPFSLGIYEDVTSFTGGSAQTPMNNNRNSSYTTELTITQGTISRTGGTLLLPLSYAGSASSPVVVSGFDSRDDDEVLLKADSTYIIELTTLTDNDVNCGIEASWYEYVPEF